ncbi:hypothetical protein [Azospirillum argentinense]|uniref:hypothetical protein n=1 Tax=Azospirillum argentinense TaxID=2970906 RepID=UPI0032DF671F
MAGFDAFASMEDLVIAWRTGLPRAEIETLLGRPVTDRELARDPDLVERVETERRHRAWLNRPAYSWGTF